MNIRSQKQKRRHIATTILLVVVAISLFAVLIKGLSLNPSIVASSQIGKTASGFDADLLEGGSWLPKTHDNKVSLGDLKGKPVVLNFWASWCVSCRQEARELETFWQRSRERGVIVLGIAIQDTPDSAREFAKLNGKSYPIALDSTGKISIDYGVSGVPETFIIDASGIIRHKESGPVTAELLEQLSLKYQANLSDPAQIQDRTQPKSAEQSEQER